MRLLTRSLKTVKLLIAILRQSSVPDIWKTPQEVLLRFWRETRKHRKDKRGEWLQSRWGARRKERRQWCALSIIHQCCAKLTPVTCARCDIHSCTSHSSLHITPVCSDVFLLTDSGIIIHTAHSLQWVSTHARTLTCGRLHKPASWQAYVRTRAQWFHPEMVFGSE